MHILISNDDGYFSEGIKQLRKGLEKTKHDISLIAPAENNSACGMSISVRDSLNVKQIGDRAYVVSGTPVDCVGIGLGGLLSEPVDMVISGVNNGPNLADDVLYSGTVAATVEARRLAHPNIAVSVTSKTPKHYDTAVKVVLDVLKCMDDYVFDAHIALLNINVPDVPYDELKGIKVTRLAERHAPQNPTFESIGEGEWRVCMGGVGEFLMKNKECEYDYDNEAVMKGYASVTPIQSKYIDTPYLQQTAQMLKTRESK